MPARGAFRSSREPEMARNDPAPRRSHPGERNDADGLAPGRQAGALVAPSAVRPAPEAGTPADFTMSKDIAPPDPGAPGFGADASVLEMLRRIAARQSPNAPPGRRPSPAPPAPTSPPVAPPAAAPAGEQPPRRRLLGEILLDEGLITRQQLDSALRLQAEQRRGVPIGQLLIEQGAITKEQLGAILDRYRFGNFLVETSAITEEQLDVALQRQKATRLRLGEVLLQLKLLTEPQLRQAIARQLGIHFVDLDQMTLDRGLAQVIDRDLARRLRVVPVGRGADHVTVAMDDPADHSAIGALWVAAGCRVEV